MESEILIILDEMCIYCNNYFNPQNETTANREYSDGFIKLAERIYDFNSEVEKNNKTSETVGSHAGSVDLDYSAWQKTFRRELAIYKKARFI